MSVQEHYDANGKLICDCPVTGECFECHTPCTDHDLVADWYWCNTCTNRSLDAYFLTHPR